MMQRISISFATAPICVVTLPEQYKSNAALSESVRLIGLLALLEAREGVVRRQDTERQVV